jgi:hypothetical protein
MKTVQTELKTVQTELKTVQTELKTHIGNLETKLKSELETHIGNLERKVQAELKTCIRNPESEIATHVDSIDHRFDEVVPITHTDGPNNIPAAVVDGLPVLNASIGAASFTSVDNIPAAIPLVPSTHGDEPVDTHINHHLA